MAWEPGSSGGGGGGGEEEEWKQKGKMEAQGGGGGSSMCTGCLEKNGWKGVVSWVLEKIGTKGASRALGEVGWRNKMKR